MSVVVRSCGSVHQSAAGSSRTGQVIPRPDRRCPVHHRGAGHGGCRRSQSCPGVRPGGPAGRADEVHNRGGARRANGKPEWSEDGRGLYRLVPWRTNLTPYARTGDSPVLVLALLAGAAPSTGNAAWTRMARARALPSPLSPEAEVQPHRGLGVRGAHSDANDQGEPAHPARLVQACTHARRRSYRDRAERHPDEQKDEEGEHASTTRSGRGRLITGSSGRTGAPPDRYTFPACSRDEGVPRALRRPGAKSP